MLHTYVHTYTYIAQYTPYRLTDITPLSSGLFFMTCCLLFGILIGLLTIAISFPRRAVCVRSLSGNTLRGAAAACSRPGRLCSSWPSPAAAPLSLFWLIRRRLRFVLCARVCGMIHLSTTGEATQPVAEFICMCMCVSHMSHAAAVAFERMFSFTRWPPAPLIVTLIVQLTSCVCLLLSATV